MDFWKGKKTLIACFGLICLGVEAGLREDWDTAVRCVVEAFGVFGIYQKIGRTG